MPMISSFSQLLIKGKPNYTKFLVDNFDGIAQSNGWNEHTQEQYVSIYNKYILDIIDLKKPIAEFDNIDYVAFCRHIFENHNADFSGNYINKIVYLFGCVYRYGVEKGDFEDNLFLKETDEFEGDFDDSRVIRKREKLVIPRSFTPESLVLLMLWMREKDALKCDFRVIGFMLMFFSGMRVGETCGLVFGNVASLCGGRVPSIIVARSTKHRSSEHKVGSKTANADRIIPIPSYLFDFITKRRDRYKALGFSDSEIDLLPVVSDDKGQGIAAEELSSFIRILFSNIKIASIKGVVKKGIFTEDQFAALVVDLNEQRKAMDDYLSERDLTAYVLRRNFATMNDSIGLDKSEFQFVFGHEVEDDVRSFYLNEDRYQTIAKKMLRNPLFLFLKREPSSEELNKVIIPVEKNATVRIRVEAKEPSEQISLSINGLNEDDKSVVRRGVSLGGRDVEPDILQALFELYKKEYDKLMNMGGKV